MQDTKIHTTTKYTESLDTSANTIAEESTSQNESISQAHNPNSETLTEQMQKNNLTHEIQNNKTQQDGYLQKLQHFYANITKHRYFISEKISYCWHAITDNDRIFHYAASLSFYSIFSIIPAFLMFFSLFSLFPSFQDQLQILKQSILDNILPDNAHEFAKILDNFLSNGKEMGFVGFLISLISSFIFFRNFDDVAARIFEAKKRGYFDSFIIYWLLITLIPMFLATSIYFNAVIVDIYSDDVITKYYSFIPMLATWIVFAMLFRVAANKPLRFFVLILASLLGAIVWYGLKIIFFYYMSYNKFYSNIYGSVSIIMFAFLWIYVSWLVVLFSMQFCKWLDAKYPCSES
ncbi:YihY/virulence factor BrkB family protein [Helicobacter bilis]|uniref:YihY/virulence factor BrkB family protein n=1 Tax=Helicobacter bilis TaxID=37372 RepID=UPI00051CFCF1|nr:YihY family inner membrane protein [Helicobacter bilis]MCI7411644.1 YihY family inner membrane protein [Helicobacter bilis]MDD7295899.1 YihY family inner membrane protein [Helicobacter bilis]MDY4400656.1 YihY family inner membrane protein [Helicobacter bilis]